MKKYKVIALSVSGKGKKIFESGDTVTEDNFPEGNAEALVKTGHLKHMDEPVNIKPNPWSEAKQKPESKETPTEIESFDLDSVFGKKNKGGKNKNK